MQRDAVVHRTILFLHDNPTFVAYAAACLVLCANLLALWAYSGVVRFRTRTVMSPEDSARRGWRLRDADPPEVARVLRAHANAQATIYPFLALGLVYVLAGGGPVIAWILFGMFAAARVAHSAAYLGGKQPWRTIAFAIGMLALLGLMVNVIRVLI